MATNIVAITGNVTRDAELRGTSEGNRVLSFTVAVNDRQRNRETGEWEDHANFIDCALFGKRAEALADKIAKGVKVTVSGRLHWSQWEAKDGSKRSKLEVYVDEVDLMAPKKKDDDLYGEDVPF